MVVQLHLGLSKAVIKKFPKGFWALFLAGSHDPIFHEETPSFNGPQRMAWVTVLFRLVNRRQNPKESHVRRSDDIQLNERHFVHAPWTSPGPSAIVLQAVQIYKGVLSSL